MLELWATYNHRQFGSRAYALKQYAILVTCKVVEPATNKEELESMVWGKISKFNCFNKFEVMETFKHSSRND